jgi:uncharacterized protein YndB with AHSA1/START domain
MKTPPVVHGSFTIERTFKAPVERAFAAWADLDTKARWFVGPPDQWTLLGRKLDFRVGGTEELRGEFGSSGVITEFTAHYYDIVPNRRLVYAYDMHHAGKHLSVSLATVEFEATGANATRMTFIEQAAFLDGEDGTNSRQRGTDAHFDRLATTLSDPRTIVSARTFDAPRDRVFEAFRKSDQLANWWGPAGFSCAPFAEFNLEAGGLWRFTMRGPDGKTYDNVNEFVEVKVPERIVHRHGEANHRFTMAMTYVPVQDRTYLVWTMRFDTEEEAEAVRRFVEPANEQNFDRLAAHLASAASR